MKTYMIISDKTGILTEPELLSLFGEGDCRQYAHKLYWGSIAMEDVPKQYQQTVQTIVDAKIARWGKPDKLRANPYEMCALYESLVNAELTVDATRDFFSSIDKLREMATDEAAIQVPNLYPMWKDGVVYAVGERVLYNDTLYKVLQAHTSQADWAPDVAASLFAKVLIPDVNVIPEWEQPDSTNPYMKGDKVMHNSKYWISIVDTNVWEPGVYGWEEYLNA